ncbi:hypothetical protein GCM10012289_63030 [Nonomuraea cavernae]|uniref:Uncharacterized protein n=1 Tax=Nonomuraea cavernae TaxID=2045107 RepID=A0A917ZB89_9ACTN|nr:hypothetical protein GCM10012289_63030 [Nonomuraea cavernae]
MTGSRLQVGAHVTGPGDLQHPTVEGVLCGATQPRRVQPTDSAGPSAYCSIRAFSGSLAIIAT